MTTKPSGKTPAENKNNKTLLTTHTEIQDHLLNRVFERQVSSSMLKRKTLLKPGHLRGTRMLNARAIYAKLPSHSIKSPELNPMPWWSSKDIVKDDIPDDLNNLDFDPSGVATISIDAFDVQLLSGQKLKMIQKVKFRSSDKKRFKEFTIMDEVGENFAFDKIIKDFLPLYGVEKINPQNTPDTITITEGRRACSALLEKGIAATGTLTGAFVAPSVSALLPLMTIKNIYLWPDNDPVGARHMNLIGNRLTKMGHKSIKIIRWKSGPRKADAFDIIEDIDAVNELYKNAQEWSPDDRIVGTGILTLKPDHKPISRLQLDSGLRPPMPKF